MKSLRERMYAITGKQVCFGLIVLVVCFFQARQLLSFNPYWGYDGGAHVNILETLLFEHRFPTLGENYLAWHEPLYYLVLVGLGSLGIPFWFPHLLIILAIDGLVFGLFRRMGHGNGQALFATIATISLPAFLEVGLYFTNEALNHLFLLALMHVTLSLWREPKWQGKTSVVFAVLVGLGLVTKITMLVAFGVVVILLVVKMIQKRTWKYLLTLLMAVVFAVGCYTPWYLVRSQSLSGISVNNYDMLPAQPFALDDRLRFLIRFDTDIFRFPFWYSGGTGFWSMLYADTVSDYYGLFENQDRKNALPESGRVITTHNGNTVSAYRKPLAEAAMRLGLLPVAIMLFGVFRALRDLKKRPSSDALVVIGFSSAFLFALIYFAYRYPYYDQGIIKSVFIAPAFVLPLAFGLRGFERSPQWVRLIGYATWTVFIAVVVALFFIRH